MTLPARWLLLGCFLASSGCSREEWKGFVYPEQGSLLVHIGIGTFPTFNDCLLASRRVLEFTDSESNKGTFECGLNCKADGGLGGLEICEETRD